MPTHALRQLTLNVYWLSPWHETDRPILGVVSGERATLIVDAGNSPAHAAALSDAIAARDLAPPAWLVLTHWHWDHVFGAATLGLPTIAQRETQRIIATMASFEWSQESLDQRVADGTEIAFCRDMIQAEMPDRNGLDIVVPEREFVSEFTIDLGGVSCNVLHVGGDHSHDSCIVHVPQRRVVFLGDCIYRDLHHGPDRFTTRLLLPLLERLRRLDAEYYVPSHHDEPLTRSRFLEEAALLETIGRTTDQYEGDRTATLAALPGALGREIDEQDRSIAEAFIEGRRTPKVDNIL